MEFHFFFWDIYYKYSIVFTASYYAYIKSTSCEIVDNVKVERSRDEKHPRKCVYVIGTRSRYPLCPHSCVNARKSVCSSSSDFPLHTLSFRGSRGNQSNWRTSNRVSDAPPFASIEAVKLLMIVAGPRSISTGISPSSRPYGYWWILLLAPFSFLSLVYFLYLLM